jgi:very-short-patch-repair endonuclease
LKTQNKSLTKALRHNPTEAEKKLWYHLRNRKALDAKFRRQQSFGPYILDFYCTESKLAIELDGGQHAKAKGIAQDEQRDEYLREEGVTVLRFWNNQLFDEFEGVLDMIYATLERLTPHPNPLPQGERERSARQKDAQRDRPCSSSQECRGRHLRKNRS